MKKITNKEEENYVGRILGYITSCVSSVNMLMLVSLYALNELFLKSLHPIFRNHFNDLLAMPLLLSYSSILIKKKLTYPFIISMIIICSFVWEFVTPIFKTNSTADWLDVVAYVVGSLLWAVMCRRR
jgi:uncharacterized membrane protein